MTKIQNMKEHVNRVRSTQHPTPGEVIGHGEWKGVTRKGVNWTVHAGDCLSILQSHESNTFSCVITSPPYFWLRDYGVNGQLGKESSVDGYVHSLCTVMDEVNRVLKKDGVLFLNLGDTYYSGKGQSHGVDPKSSKRRFGLRAVDRSGGLGIGLRAKTIIGVPWRVAIEMCNRGWILRSPIIWYRKDSLPEPVEDRPRRTYEYVLMFVKHRKYYFNLKPLKEKGEFDLWTISARPKSNNGLGTAPFPNELVQRCLSIGCAPGGKVLDPFAGSGTTLRVALQAGHPATGIDLNLVFCKYMIEQLRMF